MAAAFLAYFSFHLVHGALGLNAKMNLEMRRAELSEQLAGLIAEREALERRSALLADGSIEKDMLDERARAQLSLSRPDEIILLR